MRGTSKFTIPNPYPGKFKALCSNGTTQILHDTLNEVIPIEKCTGKFCFNITLDYGHISNDHINALIETSAHCYQEVTFNCYASKFSQFAAFSDTNGNFHRYFTHQDKNECRCSKQGSCFEIPEISITDCNCDHGDPVQRQDVIQVTEKVCRQF